MKINKIAVSIMLVLGLCCFTASAKAKKAKIKVEMIDYPGYAMDQDIPKWVMAVIHGDRKKVAKELELDKNKQLFVFQNNNADLDFLQVWTDHVDVQLQVAESFSRVVGQAADASYSGKTGSETEMNKTINQVVKTLSTIEVNGLMKEAQFWIQFRKPKAGVKKIKKDSDAEKYFTYYVVYAMDKEAYDSQLDAALAHIDDNTSEIATLKKALSQSLKETIIQGSDEDIEIVE